MKKQSLRTVILTGILIICGLLVVVFWQLNQDSQMSLNSTGMPAANIAGKNFEEPREGVPNEKNEPARTIDGGTSIEQSEFQQPDSDSTPADDLAYVKAVYEKDGKFYVDIDPAEWLCCQEAVEALRREGQCPDDGSECIVPNDYYISNKDATIKTIELSPNARFVMQTYSHTAEGDFNWNEEISLGEFKKIFSCSCQSMSKDLPYHIVQRGGVVVEIQEQYLP